MSWVLEKQCEPLHHDVRLLMLTRNSLGSISGGPQGETTNIYHRLTTN